MKTFQKISVLLLMPLLLLITSCGKDGAIGPQGENGTTGSKGDKGDKGDPGPTGIPGTANVTQYSFALFTHNGSEVQKTFALSKADFEKSLSYVFVNPGNGFWYPLPGGTVGGGNQYRLYYNNPNATSTTINIDRVTGAGTETFTMRIIVIPAAKQITASITHNQPDMKDYLAVAKYYGLPTE
jgi:hypothetical protein